MGWHYGHVQTCVFCFCMATASVAAAVVVRFVGAALGAFNAQVPAAAPTTEPLITWGAVIFVLLIAAAVLCGLLGLLACVPWPSLRTRAAVANAPAPLVHVYVPLQSSPDAVLRARSPKARARSTSPVPLDTAPATLRRPLS